MSMFCPTLPKFTPRAEVPPRDKAVEESTLSKLLIELPSKFNGLLNFIGRIVEPDED